MAKSLDSFKELDISRDEVERICEALKEKEFRSLFAEYVQEINDPENQRIYQEELTQLEKERGVDITFINPTPGYVIKTSIDGCKKAFINVCSSEHVAKPTSSPSIQEGCKGLQWSLPHSLAPPREDLDNKRIRCQVFDVVFHPDTLHLANNNPAFKDMVNRTACDAVEQSFDCKLDQQNMKFPKLMFKGVVRATVIRKPSKDTSDVSSPEEKEFMSKIYEKMPKISPKKSNSAKEKTVLSTNKLKYTTPKYEIKQRTHVDIQNFTNDRDTKLDAAIPKELVVEVNLPLLKSASDIELDVTEKTVQLTSEKPAKYKLNITLPYKIFEDAGNAKFDKDLKKLIITLPVKRKTVEFGKSNDFYKSSKEDSGVESDPGSVSPPRVKEITPKKEISTTNCKVTNFLDEKVHYTLPEFICHKNDNILVFTLNVKNVCEDSIEKIFNADTTALNIKFSSVSAGYYPVYYAICLKLNELDEEKLAIEVWDNNVVIQIHTTCDISSFLVGLNEDSLEERTFSTLSSNHKVEEVKDVKAKVETEEEEPKVEEQTRKNKVQKANKVLDTVALNEEPKTRAIDIAGSFSESSGDELSCSSYSPKHKGILKRMSSSRSSVSRSISESSVDDFTWASSYEYSHYHSQDLAIPEEEGAEPSTSLKKTVRFNNNVLRQLFRSNSSILGQKKKNQRKNKNKSKKRANERRHSESELSESERESKTGQDQFKHPECRQEKKDESIFAFDM